MKLNNLGYADNFWIVVEEPYVDAGDRDAEPVAAEAHAFVKLKDATNYCKQNFYAEQKWAIYEVTTCGKWVPFIPEPKVDFSVEF